MLDWDISSSRNAYLAVVHPLEGNEHKQSMRVRAECNVPSTFHTSTDDSYPRSLQCLRSATEPRTLEGKLTSSGHCRSPDMGKHER